MKNRQVILDMEDFLALEKKANYDKSEVSAEMVVKDLLLALSEITTFPINDFLSFYNKRSVLYQIETVKHEAMDDISIFIRKKVQKPTS